MLRKTSAPIIKAQDGGAPLECFQLGLARQRAEQQLKGSRSGQQREGQRQYVGMVIAEQETEAGNSVIGWNGDGFAGQIQVIEHP